MPEKPDIKKALEAILGHELTEDAVQSIQLIQAVASYTRSDSPGEGFTTKINVIANFPPSCEPALLLDVSGISTTGSDGKSLFRLTDFVCFDIDPVDPDPVFGQPVNVVATPLSSEPCFLTVLHSLVKNDNGKVVDVEIQVSTWDANGAAAPGVSFDWRCRAPQPKILK